jgi:hypothetical protein
MAPPRVLLLAAVLLATHPAAAPAAAAPRPASPEVHLSRYGGGAGPRREGETIRLLDGARTPLQSNAVALDREREGAFESLVLRFRLRVASGGEGGALLLLNTDAYGSRGPAPFVPDWTAPDLRGSLAVGIDVRNPPTDEPFGPLGNVHKFPEREVSLHWDGREIVKRLAPAEFRDAWVEGSVAVEHGIGGADVTVRLGDAPVYDRYFVPGLLPYPCRPAAGAGTGADGAGSFDLRDLRFEASRPAAPRRPPRRVTVFDRVLTDNAKTSFEADADLPHSSFAFGRVLMTIEIHDAGDAWDEWDRCGEVSVRAPDGTMRGIVPFITSYRTPCRWTVDVSRFRPWLAGRTRLEVAAGTNFYKNRGYRMSVTLEFHHGTPDLAPFRVIPLWHGTARHGTAENRYRDFFLPVEAMVDADAKAAAVFTTVTGHSQVGEFTPSSRTLVVARGGEGIPPAERRWESRLWREDCYLNPNRPQSGTWKYSRAGWAPGDVVHPWIVDLGDLAAPGATLRFAYEPGAYDFGGEKEPPTAAQVAEASQNVRSYLVLYRAPDALLPAPALQVFEVVAGGIAAKAGLRAGDWIESYDGMRLQRPEDLREAIRLAGVAGRSVSRVVAWRGTERFEAEVGAGRMGVAVSER